MKSSSEFLDAIIEALRKSTTIPGESKNALEQLFQLTLQHDPNIRCLDFAQILSILTPETVMHTAFDCPHESFGELLTHVTDKVHRYSQILASSKRCLMRFFE
jgi:hypothetical protein